MLPLLMDVHVPAPITNELRRRGLDVLTAQQDGSDMLPDPDLLDRAAELRRLLFTHDDDLLAEAARRQSAGEHFFGVIYMHQGRLGTRACVEDLELIAKATTPSEWESRVWYLPL